MSIWQSSLLESKSKLFKCESKITDFSIIMQSATEHDASLIARNFLRESTEKLGEAALNYVLDESYNGKYEYFNDYLQLEHEAHALLPHYYVVLWNRGDETRFMIFLSVFLRDILFYDAEEPICLQAIKDRLLQVAILDRVHLIKDILGLFEIYNQLKAMSPETQNPESEAWQLMRNLTKDHPYANTWLP